MFDKTNYVLNCDICDTRKMKEEDYDHYKKMIINADIVIVSTSSKSILNRLPVTINQDFTIEIADDVETELKVISGSYEITDSMAVCEHTLLIVNGALNIHSGTKEILEKYEKIHVNGSVRCAESVAGYLTKLSSSHLVVIYPDECMILNDTFIVDKYFPLRAKEGSRYYVKDKVIIQDKSVDLQKLTEKNIQFVTDQLIIPEEMVESCIELFDEKVQFVIIPTGMTLHYGDAVLSEDLLKEEGDSIYVYGNLKVPGNLKLDTLEDLISKLIVKETVVLMKNQETSLKRLNVEYQRLEFEWEGRTIENKPSIHVDKILLENSPNKVLVRNTATIKIAEDVMPELILNRLMIKNCARVLCNENQKSAVAAIAQNVAQIGESGGEEQMGMMSELKELLSAKVINADSYIL